MLKSPFIEKFVRPQLLVSLKMYIFVGFLQGFFVFSRTGIIARTFSQWLSKIIK